MTTDEDGHDFVGQQVAVAASALGAAIRSGVEQAAAATPAPPASGFMSLKELLVSLNISYSSYRHLRMAGKAPPEMRLSQRTIRFSREEVSAWARTAGR